MQVKSMDDTDMYVFSWQAFRLAFGDYLIGSSLF